MVSTKTGQLHGLYYRSREPCPEEITLKHRIDERYTAYPFYGSRRMAAPLRREGYVVSRKAVQRHMRAMGLCALAPGPHLSHAHREHPVFPYLLHGLSMEAPNQVWGVDIPYIRMARGWVYLVAIVDGFSRYVVSWELDTTMEVDVVLEAMRRALNQACP